MSHGTQHSTDDGDLSQHLPNDTRCIGVVSGKGGVGKSLVAALLATAFASNGDQVGILDADLTGPSIPRMFGLRRTPQSEDGSGKITPARTETHGIRVMSLNLLVDNEDDPVIWRGPLVSKTVEQFVTDVDWDGIRYLFVDLPPGTSDVPLTVMQRLPLDGLIVVSSPQDLVAMIVRKAVKMAAMLHVPVLGLVQNMTHIVCPKCGEQIAPFGQEEQLSGAQHPRLLARLPIDPQLAALCDSGGIESYARNPFGELIPTLNELLNNPGALHA
ncbi:MAG: Mrp/NBP35 family ATP-binding protein [Armatimonadetes bacterium]|nr:Mrp/NBP35 family ATP-binding protein [Armatimonadota bacterium]